MSTANPIIEPWPGGLPPVDRAAVPGPPKRQWLPYRPRAHECVAIAAEQVRRAVVGEAAS